MKSFEVKTKTSFGEYFFYTKGKNGKDALKNLITKSNDFKYILGKDESNTMTISISYI